MRFRTAADQCEVVLRHAEEGGHLAARGPLAIQAMAAGDKIRVSIESKLYCAAGALSRVLCRHANSLDFDRMCPSRAICLCSQPPAQLPGSETEYCYVATQPAIAPMRHRRGVSLFRLLSVTESVQLPPHGRIRPSGLNCLIWLWR